MNRALQAAQQEEEEDFLASQVPLYPDTVPVRPHYAQEEEEYNCGDMKTEDWRLKR